MLINMSTRSLFYLLHFQQKWAMKEELNSFLPKSTPNLGLFYAKFDKISKPKKPNSLNFQTIEPLKL